MWKHPGHTTDNWGGKEELAQDCLKERAMENFED